MKPEYLTTERKALTINLDPKIYGTFAEIGAGQEVVRHFFKAGGASGTIAKSMSAYDMKFSDEIYGKSQRYVSKERLLQMLQHEYNLIIERLNELRGKHSTFFTYANTVAARSFRGSNECHGWMGVRFQLKPLTEPNDIVVHVRMLDKTNIAQQEALGIIGVNLIYGSFIYNHDYKAFIESLADNLGNERIEVDMISFSGPAFENIDNRVMSIELVQQGLTNAVMFKPDQTVVQPSEVLYKKALLVERGSFRPITNVNLDMISCAGAQMIQEPEVLGEEILVLMEITIKNLLEAGFDLEDFLARVDIISSLGYNVLISNYPEYYRLVAYFRRYTQKMIGLTLGINHILAIFNERFYDNLDGGILEACGRLFKEHVKLYVYPMHASAFYYYWKMQEGSTENLPALHESQKDMLITANNIQIPIHLRNLYSYLLENHSIEAIQGCNREYLDIFSRNILVQIREGNKEWEHQVPKKVVEYIKEQKLFHYNEDKKGKHKKTKKNTTAPSVNN